MRIYKILSLLLICAVLVGCGPSADRVTIVTARCEEVSGLYDAMGPVVVKLDDEAVKKYDEAGAIVRKAKRAVDSKFSEYGNSELDELLVDLENAMLILRSFEGREPVKPVLKEENGTVFTVNFLNHSGIVFNKLLLKSGSGSNDVKIEFNGGFAPDVTVTEKIQAPESESFAVTGVNEAGEETVFAGSFYLSTVTDVTLTNDEGKYIIATDLKQE